MRHATSHLDPLIADLDDAVGVCCDGGNVYGMVWVFIWLR